MAREIRNPAATRIEEAVIGGVAPDQGDEGADVDFSQPVAEEVASGHACFQLVEHGEGTVHGLVIRSSRGGKTGAIAPVVEALVDARVKRVGFCGQILSA